MDDKAPKERKGAIAWMARNTVAANLLMFLILLGGTLKLTTTKQEVFPEFEIDLITVSVAYPGAAPAEVEQGAILALEEAVRGVAGVKRVNSTSVEGFGAVIIELMLTADNQKAVSDIKAAVDRVRTLPAEAERPLVELIAVEQQVISMVISGDQELQTLFGLAERARDGLVGLDGVTKVTLDGVPQLETSIEIPRSVLEGYGLTLSEVARSVRSNSLELPSGIMETETGDVLLRVSERKRSVEEYESIVIRSGLDGARLRLGQKVYPA